MAKRRHNNENTIGQLEGLDFPGITKVKAPDPKSQARMDELQQKIQELEEAKQETDALKAELQGLYQNSIVWFNDGSIQFQRVKLHRAYAELPSDVTEQEVSDLGTALIDLGDNINFWLGDIILWYFRKEGAKSSEDKSTIYKQFETRYQKSHSLLKNAVWVADKVPTSTRVDAPLSFTHYRVIVGATENVKQMDALARLTFEKDWSVRQLQEHLKSNAPDKNKRITSDNYIFDADGAIKDKKLERLWVDARKGDEDALQKFEERLNETEKWIEKARNSLGN